MDRGSKKTCVLVLVVMLSAVMLVSRAVTSTEHHHHPPEEVIREKVEGESENGSWSTWAKDRISGGLGLQSHPDEMVERTKDQTDRVASDAGRYGEEPTQKAKGYVSDKATDAGKKTTDIGDTVGRATQAAKDATKKGMEKVQQVFSDAGNYVEKGRDASMSAEEKAANEAEERYEEEKAKTGETLESSKETLSSNNDAAQHKSEEIKEQVTKGTVPKEEL